MVKPVLVQAAGIKGKGKGFGNTSGISSVKRPEEEVIEHERERRALEYSIATPRPDDDAGGGRIGADPNFVRQALVEKEKDKKEAEVVTNSMRGRVKDAFISLFATPRRPSLSPASQWTLEQDENATRERQLKEEKREAKARKEREEQRKNDDLWAEHFAEEARASAADDRASAAASSSATRRQSRERSSSKHDHSKSSKTSMPDFTGTGKAAARSLLAYRGIA